MRSSDQTIPTIIIEPHQLLREGLASLISNFSFRVIGSLASTADLHKLSSAQEDHRLVLFGSETVKTITQAAAQIRQAWPDSKVVLLFDHIPASECERVIQSEIDGCVPLFASRQVLVSTLELIVFDNVRVMVLAGGLPQVSIAPDLPGNDATQENGHATELTNGNALLSNYQVAPPTFSPDGMTSIMDELPEVLPRVASAGESGCAYTNGFATPSSSSNRSSPKLSQREWQVLDGLVKGHANKVIARDCCITEATVKVHMKSILRKIRVGNRTQAAVWALENGSTPQELSDRLCKAADET